MTWPPSSIEGEGWDHVARRVERPDGPWIVREAKEAPADERRARVAWEVAVMQAVRAEIGPVAPDAAPVDGRPEAMTYPRVAGRPLQDLLAAGVVPAGARRRLARWLGGLIARIGRLDATALGVPVVRDDAGFAAWYPEVLPALTAIRPVVGEAVAEAVERFWRTTPPPDAPVDELVLAHNDLGAEHVLVDEAWEVAGVIDWSDAAVTDPAADVGRLLRDLGAGVLDDVLAGVGVTGGRRAATAERAWCYARLLAVDDLAYALAHRPDLVSFEHATVARLFADV